MLQLPVSLRLSARTTAFLLALYSFCGGEHVSPTREDGANWLKVGAFKSGTFHF